MNRKEFSSLIDKYIAGKTSKEEEGLLINYFESFQQNKAWLSEMGSPEIVRKKIEKGLMQGVVNSRPNNKRYLGIFFKFAAVFVIAFGLLTFFLAKENILTTRTANIEQVNVTENEITLERSNGEVNILTQNEDKSIADSKDETVVVQTGNRINYIKGKNKLKNLVYNTLTVPHGKRFDLLLSDGSQIKLNSGSAIRYPVEFIEGKNREVEIWGEAYFEIAKDEKHPFIVHASNLDVRVLGTKFNVSSYEEDDTINTVLVEGSVELLQKNSNNVVSNSSLLQPNFKAALSKKDAMLSFTEVDTSIYTAWVDGKVIFKNTLFKNIRKKLERHYNVIIVNNNSSLDEKRYNASFDIETIDQVMEAFKENYDISYSINSDKIIIN